ncbi:hypothetical protein E0485_07420 [Paenibacillus albiflavus]|uniref:Uncharacterized protein n=1 Tax=Paenibacillus albiflavus TaxID=2545760 RepID=A0A4R4EI58_9BACL|nr:hypothetical protein [Paenibacillus albiflavus]TCZ78890.1 hypothetical protein E0485_07420 [Paenibacillus albiflavus]
MKRITNVFSISLIILTVLAGCSNSSKQAESSTAPTPAPTAAVTPAPSAEPEISNDPLKVSQDDTNIKVRINKPEFMPFIEKAKPGPIIPGLFQDYIPQGLAYMPEQDWLLVSYYREDDHPSLLTVVDAKTGEHLKSLQLFKEDKEPYREHAGGLTVSKKFVWIASNSNMYYIKKEDLIQAEKIGKLNIEGHFKTDVRASFNTYYDGVIWAGEFANGTADYPTSPEHHITNPRDNTEHLAWAEGFKLDEETDLPTNKKIEGDVTVPDYALALPQRIQGMTVRPNQLILSESFGRNTESSLIFHKNILSEEPHKVVDFGGNKVPLWYLDSKNLEETISGPPMFEGIVEHDKTLYILFESGANKFRVSGSYPLDRIYTLELK